MATAIGRPLDFDSDYAAARTRVEARMDALRSALDTHTVTTNGLGMTNYRHVAAMDDIAELLEQAATRLKF